MDIIEIGMSFNRFSLVSASSFSEAVSGFPVGALTEICGAPGGGKTEFLLNYLAQNPHLRVAWVEEELSVYPCAFPQRSVALERIFFVDLAQVSSTTATQSVTESLALWVVHQILQSQIFGIIIVSASIREKTATVALRRLQLLAEKSQSSVIFLSERPMRVASWTIPLQLEVGRSLDVGELWVRVLRSKGWRHQIA